MSDIMLLKSLSEEGSAGFFVWFFVDLTAARNFDIILLSSSEYEKEVP